MLKLPLGVITHLDDNLLGTFNKVAELGFPTCQLYCPSEQYLSGAEISELKEALKVTGVEITAVFLGFEGQVWDLERGPDTIGFVPPETRTERLALARRVSDFAKMAGISAVAGHVGFIPEDPNDPIYPGLIEALRGYALYCRNNGQEFWFETGQETPATLRRAIEDVGTGNLGVNLDPANLLMYGKAEPVVALDVIGDLVRGTHCKDGGLPREPGKLGPEFPLGEGEVDYPRLIAKLKALGYRGALTIEREISGEQQIKDILRAKEILRKLAEELP